MDIDDIKARIRQSHYVYTHHADLERRAEDLTVACVEEALLKGQVLEQYPDSGRGESCLVVGVSGEMAVHAVCGWRGDRIALITVYVPRPPKFVDPWTRGGTRRERDPL